MGPLIQTWKHSFSFAGFYNHKSYGNCAVSRFKGRKTGLTTSINSAKVIIFMQIHYKSSFIMCFKELSKCLKTFLAWELKVVELKHLKFWDIKIRNRFYAYFSFISIYLNLKMHFWIKWFEVSNHTAHWQFVKKNRLLNSRWFSHLDILLILKIIVCIKIETNKI